MLRQIQYFHSIVKNNSFSEAAEECHISQPAISQQLRALENELGFDLLERKNRKFSLTAAGEYFYKKTLILMADYEQIYSQAAKIAHGDEKMLNIGYLRGIGGKNLSDTLAQFAYQFPDVDITLEYGSHEKLYKALSGGKCDLVLNDQRRAFSGEYVNLILSKLKCFIEISSRSPIASLDTVSPEDLKHIPCILAVSKPERESEYAYYHDVIGFQGEFIYTESLSEAHLMTAGAKGFMPISYNSDYEHSPAVRHIPLCRNNEQITQNYCAFWKKNTQNIYAEKFAEMLKQSF